MSDKMILCIDDEKTILDSLKAQLYKSFGNEYMYEFAESANEAMEVIEEVEEDGIKVMVVVSDWLMPGMKGDEFLINLHQKFPHIVKVLLTGQADKSAIQRAKDQANLHKCLAKPWTESDLVYTINSGLRGA